jgi:ankyrin repeat protein
MRNLRPIRVALFAGLFVLSGDVSSPAQTPPSNGEIALYTGLHAAAASGDVAAIDAAAAARANLNGRDGNGRTPLHIAAFLKQYAAARALLARGADANALDNQQYDIITIASVANDPAMLDVAIAGGASARNVTSPYAGTALIAAAHLGHAEVVRKLIAAGAPLDHVNNLGWTALIESIVLGNGGRNHTDTLRALVDAGANINISDRQGMTPLRLARQRGFAEMTAILERAGAK